MDLQLPAPDIVATAVPIDTLDGTAKSIALMAIRAGYTVRATRALGPRVPRVAGQTVERQASVAVTGTMHGWGFSASHTARDGWDVVMHRPGWPMSSENILTLRSVLKAQTPVKVSR